MAVDRSKLPALGPEPSFTFPEIRRHALSNGVRVWTAEHRAVPLVSVLALLPVGAAADPDNRPGLAAVTSDLLDEGCGALTALDVHEALGRIGAHLDTEIGADATLLTLTSLTRFAGRGARLLADMITKPTFDQRDFDRVRELRLNRLLQLRDLPPSVADRTFTQMLYPGHPYGHTAIGTELSLREMTRDDVLGFHRQAYDPSRLTVIAAGDGSHTELVDLVGQAFEHWTAAPDSSEPLPDVMALPIPQAPPGIALVHRPGAAQSELRIGHIGVARHTPDYQTLLVLNMVLGGQFVSRINLNLRERKGYTYGARTSFDFRRARGPFVLQASVQSEATADAIREAMLELRAIRGDRPVTRRELETGRAALTRGYPRNFETAEHISRGAAQLALYGLPDNYFSTFVPKVLAVDEAMVTRAAAEYIDPDRMVTVIVGDRDTVSPKLPELELGTVAEVAAV